MLSFIGVNSVDDLFKDIPEVLKKDKVYNIPNSCDEIELFKEIERISQNDLFVGKSISFMGGGAYNHFIPSAVKYAVSRSEFLTAYTPYQAEMSQGLLQLIYEYQTLICKLTGMDAANASHYDCATALSESAVLSSNFTNRKEVLVSSTVNPNYRKVLKTYSLGGKFTVKEIGSDNGRLDIDDLKTKISTNTACFILQMPNFFGYLEEVFEIEKIVHQNGALFVVSIDPISLGLLLKPSEYGADVVVSEGQSLGNELNFGGPYLGIFAVKKSLIRFMPGRIVGMTNDHNGRRGFVLTLQAREQHIRREKASSNICSNQSFLALTAMAYLTYIGPKGLEKIAKISHTMARYAFELISKLNDFFIPFGNGFFKEFVVKLPKNSESIISFLQDKNFLVGPSLDHLYPEYKNHLLIAFTELNSKEQIDSFVSVLKDV